jgi:hypothetical protein
MIHNSAHSLNARSAFYSGFYELRRDYTLEVATKGKVEALFFYVWDMPATEKNGAVFRLHEEDYLRLDEPVIIKKDELFILETVKTPGRPKKDMGTKRNNVSKVEKIIQQNPKLNIEEACNRVNIEKRTYQRDKKDLSENDNN